MVDYDSTTPAPAAAAEAVRETRPPITRPRDFRRFWRETLKELARTPPNPRLGVAVTSPEGVRIAPVKFASFLAVAVPTFGWASGRRRLVKEGSGQEINEYLERHTSHEDAVMETLSYFDTVNVADRVGCRSIVGVGRRDKVVPAATVYAIANHMSPPPEIIELPVSHSDDPDERHWTRFDERWTADVAGLEHGRDQYSS